MQSTKKIKFNIFDIVIIFPGSYIHLKTFFFCKCAFGLSNVCRNDRMILELLP